ncbi:MAG: SPOR domain-containing protein [Gammaproteobacteria bacterium]|nr:SPOR domain-containing protein [Gammaproteobacteria bacterium]MDH3534139.1 SPOR domain-containing protein [Gammaproteobacteria bacterium]
MAKKESTSIWVWAFLLLLLISFVAFILFLDQKIVSSGSGSSKERQSSGSENKPTIDFYSVLPEREVEIPISEEDRDAIENPVINKETTNQSILQVGSFHSVEEADSLKAQLAFLGLEAKIKSAVVNDETWHRVQLGPFASESRLSQAKNLLIENDIKYMQRSLQQ